MKMKFIKQILILCLSCFVMSIYSMVEKKQEDQINLSVSERRINAYKEIILTQEKNRRDLLCGFAGASAVGIGGVIYYLWNESKKKEELEKKEIKDILGCYSNLNDKQKETLEKYVSVGAAAVKGDKPDLKESNVDKPWYSRTWTYLKKSTPNAALGLFTHFLWHRTVTFLDPVLPKTEKIADNLFASRTISWFIEHKTNLENITRDFVKFLSNSKNDKNELQALTMLMITQWEKIIAFMQYVDDYLPLDQANDLLLGITIIRETKENINSIGKLVTQIIRSDSEMIDLKTKSVIFDYLKKLVDKAESFETVEHSAGFENDRHRITFEKLRKLISPKQSSDDQEFSTEQVKNFMAALRDLNLQNPESYAESE